MIIDRDYVNWLANEHRIVATYPAELLQDNPWRLTFWRRATDGPEVFVNLWRINSKGIPSSALIRVGRTRHTLRGAQRIRNSIGRVIEGLTLLHLCDLEAA